VACGANAWPITFVVARNQEQYYGMENGRSFLHITIRKNLEPVIYKMHFCHGYFTTVYRGYLQGSLDQNKCDIVSLWISFHQSQVTVELILTDKSIQYLN